jgi:hypothetical protein
MFNIITLDYELFGSGQGCVFEHLINPTAKMLELFNLNEVKATFFIEILEIEALIALKETFSPDSKEYCAAIALEEQIDELVLSGHDLQLHLHPQWYKAKYCNGVWHLNHIWWSFADLPFRTNETAPGKFDLVSKGKALLEKRVRRIKSDYNCMAFRAGGYNIGNEQDSIKALVDNGIILDSSVCPGFFSNGLSNYDFTAAPNNLPHWYSYSSVTIPEMVRVEGCILELPLLTIKSTRLQRISLARIISTFRNRKYKKVIYKKNCKKQHADIIENFKNSNFDICLSSNYELKNFTRIINEIRGVSPNYPLVLIGHPKDFNFFSPLRSLLSNKFRGGGFTTIYDYSLGICS